ncbi:DUF4359 domain-containing protein [Baaleninema sp.]|uniref:DUF4359 domain-containing protein n=1 Tax=Baaleninema sp. TaxID=3101197 RepID=UPI003D076FFD
MKAVVGARIVVLGVGAVMAVTNPGEAAYDAYAGEKLSVYLKEEACSQAGRLQSPCESLVESSQPELQRLIANNTDRQNFLLFSLYHTEFAVPIPGIPSVEAHTIGGFRQFHIYEVKTEKR